MQFQIDVATNNANNTTTTAPTATPPASTPPEPVLDLLRQMLDLQRDQLGQILEVQREQLAQAKAAAQDSLGRWKNLLTRWQKDLPEFAEHCKLAYPLLEKAYIHLLSGMVDELAQQGEEALDNEFAVQDFLDRYGMRIGQISHLLSVVGPLAEAANQTEAK